MRRFVGLSVADRDRLPTRCASCVFWETPTRLPLECGARCDPAAAAAWVRTVSTEWGECGRVALGDGEVLGFIKYAPPSAVPQARLMPAGPPVEGAALIMCMHIAPDARRLGVGGVLLRAALRDLSQRGERAVQAYATTVRGAMDDVPVVGVEFLLRHGFRVVRPHPTTPLLRLDLRTLVTWTENLEHVLESLRIPVGVPRRAPATLLVTDRAADGGAYAADVIA